MQIEGAYLANNKSLSNWDVFSHIHGNNFLWYNQLIEILDIHKLTS